MPKVLCEVETQQDVEYAGAEMSGTEFKQRVVQVVCSTSWNSGIVTSLAAMFMYVAFFRYFNRFVDLFVPAC